jgi:hypothetical protein
MWEVIVNLRSIPVLAIAALVLCGCITTSMQGYVDRVPPRHQIKNIAAVVAAPSALASSMQASIVEQARKYAIIAEDAHVLLPPTRIYSNAEVKNELVRDHVDAVLVLTVGDSGVRREYAGTMLFGSYSGSSSTTGLATNFGNMTSVSLNGRSSGTMTATAVPSYRYSRETAFQARLLDVSTGRALWIGTGQVKAGGLLFMGNGANADSTIVSIFDDLHRKGLITPASS